MMSNKPSTKINDLIREHIWEDHKECDNWEEAVDIVFSSYKFIVKMSKSKKAEYLKFWLNVFTAELSADECNEFMLDAVLNKFHNWTNTVYGEMKNITKTQRAFLAEMTYYKLDVISKR